MITSPILKFDADVDIEFLLDTWNSIKENTIPYTDRRARNRDQTFWKIVKHEFDYATELSEFFDVICKPRFYCLDPNSTLPTHVDLGTKCSLNFIISDNMAPVTLAGKEYYYKCALLDVTKPHSVINNNIERVIFKMSIFNESYEIVRDKLMFNSFVKIL